jgi:chaperonin GroEL (HSP60 family)
VPYLYIGNICVVKMVGKPSDETRIIRGVALERALRHPAMPKRQEDVRIALLTLGLEFKKSWEEGTTIKVDLAPDKIGSLREARLEMVKHNVDRIVKSGANVVVVKHGIDDLHAGLLAEHKIQAVHWIPDAGGIGRLAKASGGTPVAVLDDLRPEDLGRAEVAEEIRVPRFDTRRLEPEVKTPDGHTLPEEERMFVIDGCRDPKSVTILIRAEMESTLYESERALDSSIAACQALVRDPRIVGGAGALEAELAHRLNEFALTFEDKTQIVVMAYAEALEGLVEALAENAGIDPMDATLKMGAAHANGGRWMGIDLFGKRLGDAFEMGVVEPVRIKESAIKIASEAACQLIRIDRILAGYAGPTLMPGEIPPGASEGPDVLTDAKDLPDETIRAFRKSRYLKPYGSKTRLNL